MDTSGRLAGNMLLAVAGAETMSSVPTGSERLAGAEPGVGDEYILQALQGLISEGAAALYRHLLDERGISLDRADDLVVPKVVDELVRAGMAYFDSIDPRRLMPSTPATALQGALLLAERRLAAQQDHVQAAVQWLHQLQRKAPTAGGSASHLARVMTDRDEIVELSYTMINMARRDFMTLETLAYEVSPNDANAVPPAAHVDGKVRCRSVYETAILQHTVGESLIGVCVAGGEEARVTPRLPLKMKIVDDSTALLPLTPTGMSAALLVRSSALVAALRDYFELIWARATPLQLSGDRLTQHALASADGGPPLSARQLHILRLMAAGLKDEAIARRTDASLRTVRREISAVMDTLAVGTRFAAGAAAHRLGLVR